MSDIKERLADMSALSQSRTPADALKYIEELEAKLAELEPTMVPDPTGRPLLEVCYANYVADVATKKAKELEKELEYWRGDSAAGWDKCEEYRNKLAKALAALGEAIYLLDPDDEDIAKETGIYRIVTTYKELKGESDE